MSQKLTALVHRLRQARSAMVRAELAVTGAQILFWAALIGVFAALAVRVVRRRLSRRELPSPGEVEPDPVLTN